MSEKRTGLSEKEADWVCGVVGTWLHYRDRDGSNPTTPADADHSSLLRRLLEGGRPFKAPPPTRMSYPWYGILESGASLAVDLWVRGGNIDAAAEGDRLAIAQAGWLVVGRTDRGLLVRPGHSPDSPRFLLREASATEALCANEFYRRYDRFWWLEVVDDVEYDRPLREFPT